MGLCVCVSVYSLCVFFRLCVFQFGYVCSELTTAAVDSVKLPVRSKMATNLSQEFIHHPSRIKFWNCKLACKIYHHCTTCTKFYFCCNKQIKTMASQGTFFKKIYKTSVTLHKVSSKPTTFIKTGIIAAVSWWISLLSSLTTSRNAAWV